MKRIIGLAVLLTTLAGCAKEDNIERLLDKQYKLSSVNVIGQWQMISYSINGAHTFGDDSVWNFDANGQLVISYNSSELAYNYSSNGSRIYIEDNINDIVIEYFIDYLDSSIMTISSGSKSYTFTRY